MNDLAQRGTQWGFQDVGQGRDGREDFHGGLLVAGKRKPARGRVTLRSKIGVWQVGSNGLIGNAKPMTYSLNGSRFSDQLERVNRYLGRVRNHNRPHIEYEDDLWSFFMHAWALKDWVRNDETLDVTVRERVVAAAHEEWTLRICADLANRTKHLVLDKHSRHDADSVRRDVTVVLGEMPSPSWTHHISLRGGETVIAQDLANEVVQTWQRLLAEFGIAL